jgi:hypothetical protein
MRAPASSLIRRPAPDPMGPSGSVALTNPAFSRNTFDGTVALTVSAGRHPLSDGIRRITIVGLQGARRFDHAGGTVTVEGGGLRIELRGVAARAEGQTEMPSSSPRVE